MLYRVGVIAANSFRENVRARIFHGLFGLAVVTAGYSLVVGAYALQDSLRVVSDLGSATISLYGLIVAVVIGATSLFREIELKTVFPILARPIHRWEYLVGKFLGTWLTLAVFIFVNTGILQSAIAVLSGRSVWAVLAAWVGSMSTLGLVMYWSPRLRTFVMAPWALVVFGMGWLLARNAPDDCRVLAASAMLCLCEVAVVSAIATVFAAFSSPFLTAIFTFGVVVVGRSADTLAHLPIRVFGSTIVAITASIAKVVPNLMIYLPPRGLLVGELVGTTLSSYVARSAAYALAWCIVLLICGAVVFERRDFQ